METLSLPCSGPPADDIGRRTPQTEGKTSGNSFRGVAAYPLSDRLLLACVVLAILVGTCNWGLHEDLYMSLCAGRDALALKLAEPDDWSFLTQGRVWVNQEWVSHLLLYLSYHALGDWGPILVRFILFAAMIAALIAMCLRAGLSTTPVLLAAALGGASIAPYLSIRAENFALLYFVLLSGLLLARDISRPTAYFLTLALILIWSNSHGTFLLALPMMVIGSLSILAADYLEGCNVKAASPSRNGRDASEPAHAATVTRGDAPTAGTWGWLLCISIVVFAFANPYGLTNLTFPFRQVGAHNWHQTVGIWQPFLRYSNRFIVYGGWESLPFIVLILATFLLLIFLLVRLGLRRVLLSSAAGTQSPKGVWVITSLGLWALMVCVTLVFGRAILFCALATIPVTAYLLSLLFASLQTNASETASHSMKYGVTVCSLVLFVGMGMVFVKRTVIPLLPNNPVIDSPSVSGRILGPLAIYTPPLTDFLRRNAISGRTFSTWALADVLVLRDPEIKIFLGCRAQSIYSVKHLEDYRVITRAKPEDAASASVTFLK